MQRFLDRFLPPSRRQPLTAVETLRLRTLNAFIWVSGLATILMRIILLVLGNPGRGPLYLGTSIYLIGLLVILLIERFVPYWVASLIFTLLALQAILFGDTILQLINGESVIYFIIPVAMAGLLLRPWTGYVAAAVISIGISIAVIHLSLGIPNIPIFLLFFMIALIIHQSTYRLYDAVEQERKKSHELQESEAKYHLLIDLLPVGVLIHQEGKIVLANPACLKFARARKPEELIGTDLIDRIHPDDRLSVQQRVRAAFQEGKIAEAVEEKLLRLDSSTFYAESSGTPFTYNGKPAILVVINDITERKMLMEAITQKNQRIQEMSRRLLDVQERERRLLAAELHDDLGQSLTSLKLMLELSSRARSSQSRQKKISEARELAGELMERVRNLSLDLRPAVLDDFGLFAALRWLYDRFHTQTGMRIKCNYDSECRTRLEPRVETAAFRIVQEALTNVARHAFTKEAEVTISTNGKLTVEVADNGVGFDVDAVIQDAAGSAGLSGMQERAHLLGGSVKIISEPDSGTRVIAQIPLAGSVL